MTSWECYENKWFYMKYTGKYLSEEIFIIFTTVLDSKRLKDVILEYPVIVQDGGII
jgi:hypothetical protein